MPYPIYHEAQAHQTCASTICNVHILKRKSIFVFYSRLSKDMLLKKNMTVNLRKAHNFKYSLQCEIRCYLNET